MCYYTRINTILQKILYRLKGGLALLARPSLGLIWLKKHWASIAPVALIFIVAIFNLNLLAYLEKPWGLFSSTNFALAEQSLGGTSYGDIENFSDFETTVVAPASIDNIDTIASGQRINFAIVDSSYLLNNGNPLSNILPTRDGLMIYKIQKGDSLAKIAANFGISLNTILWANKKVSSTSLKVGQEIVILPVSGILYDIQPEDTLQSIAQKYLVDVNKIISYNIGLSPASLEIRETIIIPNVKPLQATSLVESLPEYPGYFAIPTTGWNWGKLHKYNAVDIANACGTPVYASAEGLVLEKTSSGWNSGYGIYVMIEHPNSTKTRYSHLSKSLVSVGDYVSQGDLIGYIGNTGKTDGVTGCHLHFEIYGARNPFAK